MEELVISNEAVRIKIWKDIRMYMQIEWSNLQGKVNQGRCTVEEAVGNFCRNFGGVDGLFSLSAGNLFIVHLPSSL